MSDVVTGEAVVVEVRVAQMASRAVALSIDLALQFAAILGLNFLLGMLTVVTEEAFAVALTILLIALVAVGYPVIFETLSRGRSLGKLAMGLRVVSDDGGPERFRQALFRGLSGVLEFWMFLGAPALISSLISPQGKRLGDIFSGTIVISERVPRQGPPLQMPAPLAGWATTLELSRLPEDLAATARQYLTRWHQLSPQVQYDMGMRIAGQFASFVSPPPPPSAPPHAYLAAVLAERRRRTEVRLARQMRQNSAYGAAAFRPSPGRYPVMPFNGSPPPSPNGSPGAGRYPAPPPSGRPVPLPPPPGASQVTFAPSVSPPPPAETSPSSAGFIAPA
ncbi:hypothetical protein GCM10022226_59100 [Sphaerisporangium flaviroseum]|uniref:RDD domain-containing protein n=1 Tax=Sphaerisporangium flaviroseum TaxID=509199 RepID=A0ABP7IZ87_9ACTN